MTCCPKLLKYAGWLDLNGLTCQESVIFARADSVSIFLLVLTALSGSLPGSGQPLPTSSRKRLAGPGELGVRVARVAV